MANYRDPKVTGASGSSNVGKWIAIALAVLVALLLLAWLLGAFNGDEAETVPVVTTEEAPVDTTVVPVPADEGAVIVTDP